MPLAALDPGTVMILVVVLALPIGALVFALGAGGALREIGKGPMSIDQDFPQSESASNPVSGAVREEEIRQLVAARSYRREQRGEPALDVDAEVERLLATESEPRAGTDPALAEEVRQLVIARNDRRARRGEEPLDVQREVERQLRELENLGQ